MSGREAPRRRRTTDVAAVSVGTAPPKPQGRPKIAECGSDLKAPRRRRTTNVAAVSVGTTPPTSGQTQLAERGSELKVLRGSDQSPRSPITQSSSMGGGAAANLACSALKQARSPVSACLFDNLQNPEPADEPWIGTGKPKAKQGLCKEDA